MTVLMIGNFDDFRQLISGKMRTNKESLKWVYKLNITCLEYEDITLDRRKITVTDILKMSVIGSFADLKAPPSMIRKVPEIWMDQ